MVDLIGLVSAFGYFGVFLASLIGAASIFLPLPSFALVIAAGSQLDPLLVGIISGVGAGIGEMTAYGLGYGIHRVKKRLQKKKSRERTKWTHTLNRFFHHQLGFALIVIFAFTPLPDDIIGIYCGAIKYDVKKFFLAVLIGKIMLGLALAYGGFLGVELLDQFLQK